MQKDSIIDSTVQKDSFLIESSVKSIFEGNEFGTQKIEPENIIQDNTTLEISVIIFIFVLLAVSKKLFGKGITYVLWNVIERKNERYFIQEGSIKLDKANWLYILIYALTSSLFLFLFAKQNNFFEIEFSSTILYFILFFGVLSSWFAKNYILNISGFVFNIRESISEYIRFDFLIKLFFSIVILVILVLIIINPLFIYFYIGFAIWIILLLYKVFRVFYISVFKKRFAVFDICLYLCTFEILPLLVLVYYAVFM